MPSKTTTPVRQKAEAIAATRAKVGTDGKPVTTGERTEAKAAVEAKKAASAPKRRGPVTRITDSWKSKAGKEVKAKDRVKTKDGLVLDVTGRYTGKDKVPMLVGTIVKLPTGEAGVALAKDGKGKKAGDRQQGVTAADCTHVKASS